MKKVIFSIAVLAILFVAKFVKSETVTVETYVRSIYMADIVYLEDVIRYYDVNKKALKLGKKGPFQLNCGNDREKWNESDHPIWDGDTPRFKTVDEKLVISKAGRIEALKQALRLYLDSKYNGSEQAGLLALVTYGNSNQKSVCKDIFDWMFDIVQKADFLSRLQAVAQAENEQVVKDVSLDFSNNDTSKPPFTYMDVLIME